MLRALKQPILAACLAALVLLAACGQRAGASPASPADPAPWQPEAVPAIAGEEGAAPPAPADATDGLEGSYYNDFLRETLTLSGRGECTLSWPGGVMGGTYERADSGLRIRLAELSLDVWVDERGDLSVAGKQGAYLRDWDFWGITPAETGIHPVSSLPDTEEFALGGGAYRYRDFGSGLALSYDGALRIAAGKLPGAVCVADGSGGFVVGRNVTARYLTRSGSASEFLEDYIRADVFSDFAALYGPVGAYDGLRLLSGETEGRLAAGELRLSAGEQEIAARVILYTSVYPDGTENFVCKCIFAPAAAEEQLAALAAGVFDLGAARIIQIR